MQNFAEKPFAGISAAAFGEILRANFLCQRGDFRRLGHAGVVFPKPRHRGGVFGESLVERQRLAVRVHGQRRAAGGVHADADDLFGLETADGFFGVGERFLDA